MIVLKPLRSDLKKRLKRANLWTKYQKQEKFFKINYRHPSLHTEKLKPHHLNLYSFRINRQWRAIFIFTDNKAAEVIDVNPHYND